MKRRYVAPAMVFAVCLGAVLAASAAEDESTKRDRQLLVARSDAATVKKGKKTYAALCQACHGDEKVSGDAPTNLFDPKWYHGSRPSEVERGILNGFPDKGMTAWKDILPPDDVTAVTAYLLSFQKN